MGKITIDVENSIVALTNQGYSSRKIAKRLKVCHRTVLLAQKRRQCNPARNAGGRPRVMSNGDARVIERMIKSREARTPMAAAKAINKDVSEWTVRRALKRIGLVASIKKKKPALSEKNVRARLKFCKEHKNWTVEDWKRVIWTDETKINRYQSDGKAYYWHRPNEKLQKHQVKETLKHGGGSLMVWGCFTWWHIGPLIKINGIMKKEDYLQILKTNLPDFVEKCAYPEEEIVFQQDGDPKHTAKIVKEWLGQQNFLTMQWPAQSPDLNPIENLWAIVKRQLLQYEDAPTNLNELWTRVQTEWQKIPDRIIQNLVESMPRRVNSVIKNKGLWTKY